MTVWLAVGAALGGLMRFAAEYLLPPVGSRGFPRATLAVNLLGSFAIGLAQAAAQPAATVLTAGVCGALTTFSGVSLQAHRRITSGAAGEAAAYLGVTVTGCVALAWLGLQVAGRITG